MSNAIISNNGGGTCGITGFSQREISVLMASGEFDSQDACEAYIAERDISVSHRITDTSSVPSDRTFREAWTDDNETETVDVDMPRARVIQMDRIRGKRNSKFSDLDQAYMVCDEQEDSPGKSAIAAQKQVLRDLPATFDLESITDPDVLKDTWPPEVL